MRRTSGSYGVGGCNEQGCNGKKSDHIHRVRNHYYLFVSFLEDHLSLDGAVKESPSSTPPNLFSINLIGSHRLSSSGSSSGKYC